MGYRGKHRRAADRGRLGVVALAAVLTGSALVAPLSVAGTAQAHERPVWLQGSDIAVNPPGPLPGQTEAPMVDRGYVITGDQLARYDITATPAAQQEIDAFAAEVARRGVTLREELYRVYATPPIRMAAAADGARRLNAYLSRLRQHQDLVEQHLVDPGAAQRFVAELVAALRDVAANLEVPGIHLEPIVRQGEALLAQIGDSQPDPAALVADLLALVSSIYIDEVLYAAGLPSQQEIVDDPAHALPFGTDVPDSIIDGTLGNILILPVTTDVQEIGAAFAEGRLMVATAVENTALAEPVATALAATEAVDGVAKLGETAEPEWEPSGGSCLRRKSNDTAWYDPCSFFYRMKKDGDPKHFTWSHKQYGTAKSKGIWRMTDFEVYTEPLPNSTPQDWLDWGPAADESASNCTQRAVGVEWNGVGVQHTTERCEMWDIAKYAQGGKFQNEWHANPWKRGVGRSERSVAAMKATATTNNHAPKNKERYDYYAW